MRRRLVLALGLLVLVVLAGCSSPFGGGGPDETQLNRNANYDWDTNATATYNVTKTQFSGIIAVENESHIELWQRDELGTEEPLDVAALRFRHPNGTVVAPSGRVRSTATASVTTGRKTSCTTIRTSPAVAPKAIDHQLPPS